MKEIVIKLDKPEQMVAIQLALSGYLVVSDTSNASYFLSYNIKDYYILTFKYEPN